MEVIKSLKKKYNFSFLPINAMSLTNPNTVYSVIYEYITGWKVPPASAALFLDDFFKKKDKAKILMQALQTRQKNKQVEKDAKKRAEHMRVILVDELDALMTKKQTLLYNLFDWPCH